MLGRIFLTIDAVGLLFGSVIADWNETHIYNPRWPPHAKFHNAQTMSMSVVLGLATLYFTWRRPITLAPSAAGTTATSKTAEMTAPEARAALERDSLRTAAFTGSLYWAAGLAAILFPGTMGLDPEFGGPGFPQAPIFSALMGLGLLGWLTETWGQ